MNSPRALALILLFGFLLFAGCTAPISSNPVGGNNTPNVSVKIPPSTLKLTAASTKVPSCTIGKRCDVPLASATGGTPPYSFSSGSFAAGAPPMGLIIDLNGHAVGTVNPNLKPRQYTLNVCVQDAALTSVCTDEVLIVEAPTPAWTLSGRWSGPVTFQDNFENPNCKYEGQFDLDLQETAYNNAVPLDQRGTVTGSSVTTVTKSTKLLQTYGAPACLPIGAFPAQQLAGEFKNGHLTIGNANVQFSGDVNGGQMILSWTSGTVGRATLTKQNS